LLAHSPEVFVEAEKAGFELYFCGHTHGGQVCLPGDFVLINNARSPRKLCKGSWSHGRMSGYTSPGTGCSGLPVRFNCPPTIALHILNPA